MAAKHPKMQTAHQEYVTGGDDVTLQSLSTKHSISIQAIRQHSCREKWVAERERFRAQARTETLKLAAKKIADVRVRHMKIAKQMQDLALAALQRYLIGKDDEGKPVVLLHDPTEIRQFLHEGLDAERKAAGLEEKGAATASLNLTPQDLEKMSDEELDAAWERVKLALS